MILFCVQSSDILAGAEASLAEWRSDGLLAMSDGGLHLIRPRLLFHPIWRVLNDKSELRIDAAPLLSPWVLLRVVAMLLFAAAWWMFWTRVNMTLAMALLLPLAVFAAVIVFVIARMQSRAVKFGALLEYDKTAGTVRIGRDVLAKGEIACIDVIRVTYLHWTIRRGAGNRDYVFVVRKGVAQEEAKVFVLDGYLMGRIARRAAEGLDVELFWFERQVRAI